MGCGEKKRDGHYIQEVLKLRDPEHAPFIFFHMIPACVFCAGPTPALSSLTVTLSKLFSHFLFIMPACQSNMLSEPCSCWLHHVLIILFMHYILFLLTTWIYKICPTFMTNAHIFSLMKAVPNSFYQVCARSLLSELWVSLWFPFISCYCDSKLLISPHKYFILFHVFMPLFTLSLSGMFPHLPNSYSAF